jgi:hypothetical protein
MLGILGPPKIQEAQSRQTQSRVLAWQVGKKGFKAVYSLENGDSPNDRMMGAG